MSELDTGTHLFNVGDILYTKVQYYGCSYHYEFGMVTRITKTGKYRVHYLNQISGDIIRAPLDQSGVSPSSNTPVKPDISSFGVPKKRERNKLVNKDGYYKLVSYHPGYFKKYDLSMNLCNYYDLGD